MSLVRLLACSRIWTILQNTICKFCGKIKKTETYNLMIENNHHKVVFKQEIKVSYSALKIIMIEKVNEFNLTSYRLQIK